MGNTDAHEAASGEDNGRTGQRGDELLPRIYDELRRLARQRMAAERPDHTLQPTALVHEAYLRMSSDNSVRWRSEGHFFSAAAEAMRRVLVDWARGKGRIKRGGGVLQVPLQDGAPVSIEAFEVELPALDEALVQLEKVDWRKAEVVKLRYFAGLSIEQTASALKVSTATVERDWAYAKAWLYAAVDGDA